MGLDYAYEMWVPEEKIYALFEAVNNYAYSGYGTIFYWPDGRQIKFLGSDISHKDNTPKEVAFDCSFDEHLCTSLLFEPDEVLGINESKYLIPEIGKYRIGCIYMGVQLSPNHLSWLDEEGYCARISFTAATTGMSHTFQDSHSIQSRFVELARDGGAISCLLDCEGNDDRILFLDGKEVNKQGFAYAHFRDFRGLLNPEAKLSDNENRLLICQHNGELSHHELLARIEWAKFDEDSGIRAAACKSLANLKNKEVENLLCDIAQNDRDWRVRYVALCCFKEYSSSLSDETLFKALYDENYQVQIAAMKTWGYFNRNISAKRNLADELERLVEKLAFRGPSMGAFITAMRELSLTYKDTGEPHHAQIIRQRMSEPDFPFEAEATKAIERLEDWSQRFK